MGVRVLGFADCVACRCCNGDCAERNSLCIRVTFSGNSYFFCFLLLPKSPALRLSQLQLFLIFSPMFDFLPCFSFENFSYIMEFLLEKSFQSRQRLEFLLIYLIKYQIIQLVFGFHSRSWKYFWKLSCILMIYNGKKKKRQTSSTNFKALLTALIMSRIRIQSSVSDQLPVVSPLMTSSKLHFPLLKHRKRDFNPL